jgi:TRAP-type C4-dicarboxylate transport system permease small subunit
VPDTWTRGHTGAFGVAARIITIWAILGGIVLLAVVAMNVISVVGAVFGKPFPGDFEMTEVGVAVAAFAFLPYCQLTDANVTADIFTAHARPRTIALFKLLASLVALLFAAMLLWRMYEGMGNQREYGYTTAILQFPSWTAYIPILISLALLVVAAFVTLIENGRRAAHD